MASEFDKAFNEFKKVPDWDRFPMPEIIYKKYGIRKPEPADIGELTRNSNLFGYGQHYTAPIELRGPVEGGVRDVPMGPDVPVETKVITDETENGKQQDSAVNSDALPKEDSKTNTPPSLGHWSEGLSNAAADTSAAALCPPSK